YFIVFAAIALAACSRNIQNKEAIEKAIWEYLNSKSAQTGLDMNAMTIEVTSMSFEKDSARAGVNFKLKSGDGGMQMQYALNRESAGVNQSECAGVAAESSQARRTPATRSRIAGAASEMKTVAVLGGGPAGALAAEHLARAGLKTYVFDEKLAWEKPCGGGVT